MYIESGSGGYTHCTTNNIGDMGSTNCDGSGGMANCTSNTIGESTYTNCR